MPSLKRLAADRLRPQLAAEDAKRLTDLTSEQSCRAIAGSWVYDWQ